MSLLDKLIAAERRVGTSDPDAVVRDLKGVRTLKHSDYVHIINQQLFQPIFSTHMRSNIIQPTWYYTTGV